MDADPGPAPRPEPPPGQDPNGPPLVGWAVPAPDAPGEPSRMATVIAWIAALVLAGFVAWLKMRGAEGTGAFRAGVAVGSLVAPFLFSAILRLIVVRIREGRFTRAALRSPWVPLGTVIIVILSTFGGATR